MFLFILKTDLLCGRQKEAPPPPTSSTLGSAMRGILWMWLRTCDREIILEYLGVADVIMIGFQEKATAPVSGKETR